MADEPRGTLLSGSPLRRTDLLAALACAVAVLVVAVVWRSPIVPTDPWHYVRSALEFPSAGLGAARVHALRHHPRDHPARVRVQERRGQLLLLAAALGRAARRVALPRRATAVRRRRRGHRGRAHVHDPDRALQPHPRLPRHHVDGARLHRARHRPHGARPGPRRSARRSSGCWPPGSCSAGPSRSARPVCSPGRSSWRSSGVVGRSCARTPSSRPRCSGGPPSTCSSAGSSTVTPSSRRTPSWAPTPRASAAHPRPLQYGSRTPTAPGWASSSRSPARCRNEPRGRGSSWAERSRSSPSSCRTAPCASPAPASSPCTASTSSPAACWSRAGRSAPSSPPATGSSTSPSSPSSSVASSLSWPAGWPPGCAPAGPSANGRLVPGWSWPWCSRSSCAPSPRSTGCATSRRRRPSPPTAATRCRSCAATSPHGTSPSTRSSRTG